MFAEIMRWPIQNEIWFGKLMDKPYVKIDF